MASGADASVVDDIGEVVTVKFDLTLSNRFLFFFILIREKQS